MKKVTLAVLSTVLCIPVSTFAAAGDTMMRGGFGFLYGDINNFTNPGNFATNHNVAAELEYTRTSVSETQGFSPSLVYGNGNFGFGVEASRTATSLTNPNNPTDVFAAGLGMGLLKDRLTWGFGYERNIGAYQTNSGIVDTTLTLSGPGHMGPALGVGFGTTINGAPNVQTGNVALGYRFKANTTLEGGATFNDLSNSNNFTGNLDMTFGGQYVYMGLGYRYYNLMKKSGGAGRLGVIMGRWLDISVLASSIVETGADVTYGVTLRATF